MPNIVLDMRDTGGISSCRVKYMGNQGDLPERLLGLPCISYPLNSLRNLAVFV